MSTILHAESFGNAPDKVLFLHGFMGCASDWQPIISFLKNDHCCIAMDLPGHGKSVGVAQDLTWDFTFVANAVIETLVKMDAVPCDLVGYSMGGRLALYLALTFPKYFRRVVLESASPGLRTPDERAKRQQTDQTLALRLENEPFSGFLDDWYRQPLFATLRNHSNFELLFRRRNQNQPKLLAKSLRELGTGVQPSLWDALPELKNPMVLLVGEKDVKFRAIAEQMQSHNAQISIEIVQNTGHNIHAESPVVFANVVQRFLR